MDAQARKRITRWCRENLRFWLLLFAIDLVLLWVSGAFRAEFGEYPDEPSHFVTALMVRDYMAEGFPSSPLRFATDYYYHYPKVAMGHYPPFLYVVLAAWMLVFPVSKASLLVANAILTALTGTLLFHVARREFGVWAGVGAGVVWVALPAVQSYGGQVMAEPLVAALAFGAVICYGRYLENPRWGSAAAFGLLAALAILTKQLALFLALVPVIAVPLARRLRLVLRASFWLPAVIVAAVAGTWYAYVHTWLVADTVRALSGHTSPRTPLAEQAATLVGTTGYALLIPMALGLWAQVLRPCLRRQPVPGRWAAYAGHLAAYAALQGPMPVVASEVRHIISFQPAMVLFAVAGIAWLSGFLATYALDRVRWATALALVSALGFTTWTFRVPHRRYHGFSEAAALVLRDPGRRNSVSLVCGDGNGEGAFVATVAASDRRSGHVVLRANKVLARTDWLGKRYEPKFKTPEELQAYLESIPVRILAVQAGAGPPAHIHWRLVNEVLRLFPDRWKLVGVFPVLRPPSTPGGGVRVYRLVGQGGTSRAPVQFSERALQRSSLDN